MSQRRAARFVFACVLFGAVAPSFAASFTVGGNDGSGKTLAPGSGATETGSVTAAGNLTIASGSTPAVTVNGGSGGGGGATARTAVIDNSGIIRQNGSGRAIRANSSAVVLNITNQSGATLSANGDDAVQVSASAAGSSFTLINSGTVLSTSARAINLRDIGGSNTITNNASGILRSTGNDAVRPGVNGIINNSGSIVSVPATETVTLGSGPNTCGSATQATGNDGIQADPDGTTVVTGVQVTNNNGATISGRHGITGSATSSANFTITVTNNTGGTITGVNGSGINIDNNGAFLGNATVINSGSIIGSYDASKYNTGDGDGVDIDGILMLTNNGFIRGTGGNGNGSDCGGNNPEGVSIGGGAITNNAGAEITGQETTGSGRKGHGVLVDNSSGGNAFSATSVINAGLIRGYDSYAIRFIGNFADTITNSAGGTIRGGGNAAEGAAIQTGDGADTINNYATITGDNGLAIDLEAGNDALHIFGGSISGDISGGSGTNTLDFDTGTAFSYSGTLSSFSSVEIKNGSVSLSGASSYTGNTTITAGSLRANNSAGRATGTGTVIVKSGATLGGNGTVGNVSAESGGTLAPGNSPGTLTVGDLVITAGSRFQFELGSTSDLLNVSGTLSFSGGGAAVIDLVNSGIVAGSDYTLISFAAASGLSSANLTLGSIPPGIDATLEVTASAVILHVGADLSVSPGSLSFPSTVVDVQSAERTVTLTYSGSGTLNVGTPTISGTQGSDFGISSNTCTSPVAASGTCSIGIRFTPSSTGSRTASLSIPSNSATSPTLVSLSGTGVAANVSLQASPASLSFGNQPVNSSSGVQTVTLSNNGNVSMTVTGFVASGSHPTDFIASGDNCSGHVLAVNASCTVSFSFTPAAAGIRSASKTVNSNPAQTGTVASIAFSGTGSQASVSFSPASLSFGNQVVGTQSSAQTLMLSNQGNSPLSITSIVASGDFSQTHACGTLLAANTSCNIDVSFSPTASGPRSGSLSVISSAPTSPDFANLGGIGIQATIGQAAIGVSANLAFGSRTVGSTSPVSIVNVTNLGTAALLVGTPSLIGSYPGDYAVSSNACIGDIAPGSSCTIGLTFTPSAAGLRNASLIIPSNAPGSPNTLPLLGSGVAAGAKPGKLSLSAAKVTAKEQTGSAVFKVARTSGTDGAVSVHYATADGTALAGQDYTSTTGTLSWEAGDKTPKIITVPVINDLQVEGKESFSMSLSAPTGGAVLGRSLSTGNITSDDRPGSLSLTLSSVTVSENVGTVTITLRRTGGNGNDVGIHYASANGTALAGSDYGAVSGDLNWAAGDVSNKSFTLPILWDSAVEKKENFSIILSAPTGGAKLGSPKTQTINISNLNH